jgi:hypothetical protein
MLRTFSSSDLVWPRSSLNKSPLPLFFKEGFKSF